MSTTLMHAKKFLDNGEVKNLDDINSLVSSLMTRLCDAFLSCMPTLGDRILKNVENPKGIHKEFTYDEAMFRDYFRDKFFGAIVDEVSEMDLRERRHAKYIIRSTCMPDSSIYVHIELDNDGSISQTTVNRCVRHAIQFFINIVDEECFKYTVVQPDKSVETFYIPKGDGSKSVTVRDKDMFVYRDIMAETEDTIQFSRLTKKPVLYIAIANLEEVKTKPE